MVNVWVRVGHAVADRPNQTPCSMAPKASPARPTNLPATTFVDFCVDEAVGEYAECFIRGRDILRHPLVNKGTAFTREERRALGIEGLIPDQVSTLEGQVKRAYAAFRAQPDAISKHVFLRSVQDHQEILYFALLSQHLEEMLPIVYTPTVGDAVKRSALFSEAYRGIAFAPSTIERADDITWQHPYHDVRLVVATDSSAILGLGDQGAGGSEIAIGKLAIYTAAGGVAPHQTLPATLDVGTDRETLRDDPIYVGVDAPRLRGDAYFEFTDRFVNSIWGRWPSAVLQWEDLSRDAAFAVLERYRDAGPTFNDDIQGTGAVVLAGILAACARKGTKITDELVVIHGAGAGGLGVAWAIRAGLERAGLSEDEARSRVLVLDSRGLLVRGEGLDPLKDRFAQDRDAVAWAEGGRPDLLETVRKAHPTVLIGLSGVAGAFDEAIVRAALEGCEAPIVMPLSNPTSHSEALPADVIRWTDGRAIVATGSPFDPVEYNGRTIPIGQGNNAFIFPGLGHGVVIADARVVTDGMIIAAAESLAEYTLAQPEFGERIYPPIHALPDAARAVAAGVVREAVVAEVAQRDVDTEDIEGEIERAFWKPKYTPVRASARSEGGLRLFDVAD